METDYLAYDYLTIKEENEIHGSINEEEIVDLVTNKNIFNEDQILQIEAIDNINLNATNLNSKCANNI